MEDYDDYDDYGDELQDQEDDVYDEQDDETNDAGDGFADEALALVSGAEGIDDLNVPMGAEDGDDDDDDDEDEDDVRMMLGLHSLQLMDVR